MVSDAGNDPQVTVVLGNEFDEALRAKLSNVLQRLGATYKGSADRFVAGSQELEQLEAIIGGQALRIEAETYVGLSVTGPHDLVQRVQSLLAQ